MRPFTILARLIPLILLGVFDVVHAYPAPAPHGLYRMVPHGMRRLSSRLRHGTRQETNEREPSSPQEKCTLTPIQVIDILFPKIILEEALQFIPTSSRLPPSPMVDDPLSSITPTPTPTQNAQNFELPTSSEGVFINHLHTGPGLAIVSPAMLTSMWKETETAVPSPKPSESKATQNQPRKSIIVGSIVMIIVVVTVCVFLLMNPKVWRACTFRKADDPKDEKEIEKKKSKIIDISKGFPRSKFSVTSSDYHAFSGRVSSSSYSSASLSPPPTPVTPMSPISPNSPSELTTPVRPPRPPTADSPEFDPPLSDSVYYKCDEVFECLTPETNTDLRMDENSGTQYIVCTRAEGTPSTPVKDNTSFLYIEPLADDSRSAMVLWSNTKANSEHIPYEGDGRSYKFPISKETNVKENESEPKAEISAHRRSRSASGWAYDKYSKSETDPK